MRRVTGRIERLPINQNIRAEQGEEALIREVKRLTHGVKECRFTESALPNGKDHGLHHLQRRKKSNLILEEAYHEQ